VTRHRRELYAHCYQMLGSPGVRPTLRLLDRLGRDGSDNVLLRYAVTGTADVG